MTTPTKTDPKVAEQDKKTPEKPQPKQVQQPEKQKEPTVGLLIEEVRGLNAKVDEIAEWLLDHEQEMAQMNAAIVALLGQGDFKAKRASKFGGKSQPQKVLDTKTGKVYDSLTQAGKDLASEVGANADDHFVFYHLDKAFPGRFQKVDS